MNKPSLFYKKLKLKNGTGKTCNFVDFVCFKLQTPKDHGLYHFVLVYTDVFLIDLKK